jgi:hypothetical protein
VGERWRVSPERKTSLLGVSEDFEIWIEGVMRDGKKGGTSLRPESNEDSFFVVLRWSCWERWDWEV